MQYNKPLIIFDTSKHLINKYQKDLIHYFFGFDNRVKFTSLPFCQNDSGFLSFYMDKILHICPEKMFEFGFEVSGYFHELGHLVNLKDDIDIMQDNYGISTEKDENLAQEMLAMAYEIQAISYVDPVWADSNLESTYTPFLRNVLSYSHSNLKPIRSGLRGTKYFTERDTKQKLQYRLDFLSKLAKLER